MGIASPYLFKRFFRRSIFYQGFYTKGTFEKPKKSNKFPKAFEVFFGSAESIKKERNRGIDLLEKGLNRQLPDYWFFNNIISGDIPCIGQLMSRNFAKIRLVIRLSFLLNLRLRFFYNRLTRSCREK